MNIEYSQQKCLITFRSESKGNYSNAVPYCQVHNMEIVGGANGLCPIGHIEEATAQAIKEIHEAKTVKGNLKSGSE